LGCHWLFGGSFLAAFVNLGVTLRITSITYILYGLRYL
jgi:hypothetical protein